MPAKEKEKVTTPTLKRRPLREVSCSSKKTKSDSMTDVLAKGFETISNLLTNTDRSSHNALNEKVKEQGEKLDLLTTMLSDFILRNKAKRMI